MITRNAAAKYIIENTVEGEMEMVSESDLVGYRFWIGKQITCMMVNRFEGMHYEVFQKWAKVYTSKGSLKIQREAINRFTVIGNGTVVEGLSEVEAIEYIKGLI